MTTPNFREIAYAIVEALDCSSNKSERVSTVQASIKGIYEQGYDAQAAKIEELETANESLAAYTEKRLLIELAAEAKIEKMKATLEKQTHNHCPDMTCTAAQDAEECLEGLK